MTAFLGGRTVLQIDSTDVFCLRGLANAVAEAVAVGSILIDDSVLKDLPAPGEILNFAIITPNLLFFCMI